MRVGIISPRRISTPEVLSGNKVETLKDLVDKFPGRWEERRRALNQNFGDLKNKAEIDNNA